MNKYIIFKGTPYYPDGLYDMCNPPEELYCMGNRELLKKSMVTITGVRHASKYGREVARNLSMVALNHGWIPVSSGAQGIGEAVHDAGMAPLVEPETIIIAPSLDFRPGYYEQVVANGGLVISPNDDPELSVSELCIRRNKVLAAISCCYVMVEGAHPSGVVSGLLEAKALGRLTLAIPGRIDDEHARACNEAIVRGDAQLLPSYNAFSTVLSQLN